MQVQVKSAQVAERPVTAKNGRTYTFREQEGWVLVNGETRRIRISLADKQDPFQPGHYELSEESFSVGKFGDLNIGRVVLRAKVAPAASVRA